VARSMPPARPADPAADSIDVQTPGVEDTAVQATVLLETECGRAAADAEYFIPESFSEHIVPSGTGKYGYRTKCPLWVVDFSMNSKSHSQLVNGVRVRHDTRFYGLPYDLPSSASAAGTSPTVKEDCERLRVEYIIYAKFKHEANFVLVKHITARGLWGSPGQCTLTKKILDENSFITKAPESNVRVIRVACRVKERTSWQEAGARADNPASQ
ncbi:MAG TPA: hypothetical protein VFV34_00125, partial [Blastocatellia bacterium]|nr:hypothetical protein [Blastocatellia bacterium]